MITGAVIVTHGPLGQVMVEEAEHLLGSQERFCSISTVGLSATDITGKVREVIGEEPWIVFTDTPGTSPTVRSCVALTEGQVVVTGVNIGMILSFLMHRPHANVYELANRMVEDGRRSLEVHWPLSRG